MRELLIIRHAIAFERDAERWPDDDARPLTRVGAKRFMRAARGLRNVAHVPDRLLSSPLVRAWETAEILSHKANFPAPERFERLRPEVAVEALAAALQRESAKRLALVGHEPLLSALIEALLAGQNGRKTITMKKGAVALLEFDSRIAPGRGRLLALLPPRVLRAVS